MTAQSDQSDSIRSSAIHRALSDAAAADVSTLNLTQPGEPIVLKPINATAIPTGIMLWLDEPNGAIVGNLRLTVEDALRLVERIGIALSIREECRS